MKDPLGNDMEVARYICVNSEFRRSSDPFLDSRNRAFRFGDALVENIHAFATEAQFLEQHFKRLVKGTDLLYMKMPAWLTVNYLAQLVSRLLNRNRIFGGAAVRLTLCREAGEHLKPEGNEISFILESRPLPENHYILNEKGMVVDLCREYRVQSGVLSSIKDNGSLVYVLASLYCERNHLDETLLLNESGRIAGTCRANLFLVKDGALFTPGLDQGCRAGVMREVIIKIALDSGMRVNDEGSFTPAVLEDADEMFLTNALEGIRWVGAYKQKRYYRRTSQLLLRTLNELAFGKL